MYDQGNLIQYLEGSESAVVDTVASIRREPRYKGLIELVRHPISKRAFPDWPVKYFSRDLNGTHESGWARITAKRMYLREPNPPATFGPASRSVRQRGDNGVMKSSEGLEEGCSHGDSGVPLESSSAISADLRGFEDALRQSGIAGPLRFLSARTSHRFTGVLRFDGDLLRSVALVDKWLPEVERGDDVPLAQAYCAHLKAVGEPLDVTDGRTDPRTPWMAESDVASYCGAVICDENGEACRR